MSREAPVTGPAVWVKTWLPIAMRGAAVTKINMASARCVLMESKPCSIHVFCRILLRLTGFRFIAKCASHWRRCLTASACSLGLAFGIAASARASPIADVHDLVSPAIASAYDQARWAEVIELGEKANTAASLTMAARAASASLLVHAAGLGPPKKRAEHAVRLAQRALALDPQLVEAHLQYATALGLYSRLIGHVSAARQGIAAKTRNAAERAISLAPDAPWGYAYLGIWHLEVINVAGGIGARFVGANLNEGLGLMDRAVAMSPPDPLVFYQIALALAVNDPKKHRARIDRLLNLAVSSAPKDAFESYMIEQARQLKAIFLTNNSSALQAFLKAEYTP